VREQPDTSTTYLWGDEVVARSNTRCVLVVAVAGCLFAGAAGCQFHRTGHGFVLRSQWSLEYSDTNGVVAQGIDKASESSSPDAVRPIDRVQSEPELLSFRNRFKNHRLAARLFHRDESDGEIGLAKEATVVATPASRPEPPLATAPTPAESFHDKKALPPSPKPADLRIPSAALSQPESKRPDLVLD
jgi:hypothetical protein